MCKRNTGDPLVRAFLDDYGVNLLRVPRQGADCGDLYVRHDGVLSAPGAARELFEPEVELPPVTRGEQLADIRGTLSNGFDVDVGFGLLAGFFAAVGAGGIVDETKAHYKQSRGSALRFAFRAATRDSVDPFALGTALSGKRFKADHPFVAKDSEYFVVAGVVRTPSISVVLEDSRSRAVDLEAGLLTFVNAQSAVSAKREREGEVTYDAGTPLAIAIEVYEIAAEDDGRRLAMRPSGRPLPFRAAQEPRQPVYLAGEDDTLLDVAG